MIIVIIVIIVFRFRFQPQINALLSSVRKRLMVRLMGLISVVWTLSLDHTVLRGPAGPVGTDGDGATCRKRL